MCTVVGHHLSCCVVSIKLELTKKNEIIKSTFSDHNEMKQEINSRNKIHKHVEIIMF